MLHEYKRKRDFAETPEPAAGTPRKRSTGDLKFVVQQHSARRMHWDFRLEIDGVLVSWAVPKGPSNDSAERRLAVRTEDHPMDYASFEGVIPAGQYGAGPVIVWDNGTYFPEVDGKPFRGSKRQSQDYLKEGLEEGKLSIYLMGEKLHGSWTLVKIGKTDKDWLLIKHHDQYEKSGGHLTDLSRSVMSGRTVEDVRNGLAADVPKIDPGELPGAKSERFPKSLKPMLASLVRKPFDREGWLYEPKMDGIRTIAFVQGKENAPAEVRLESRRGLDMSSDFAPIVASLQALPHDVVLDGEIVALDEKGKPSFQLLQQRAMTESAKSKGIEAKPSFILYFVFDILHFDSVSLKSVPLQSRKELLRQVIHLDDRVRVLDSLTTDGITAYRACVDAGLEGIIAKRADSTYEPGRRTATWLKVKSTQTAEFVICGYSFGTGSREDTFGALILGVYDDDGNLKYAGRCGTGFDMKLLNSLKQTFSKLRRDSSPVGKVPGAKQVHWLKPQLVAEIKFAEITDAGKLRIPVFVRLREDKSPSECTLSNIKREVKPVKPAKGAERKTTHLDGKSTIPAEFRKDAGPGKESDWKPYPVDESVISDLENPKNSLHLQVEGQRVAFSNLDKVFWPATGEHKAITKRDLAIYMCRVAPWLIPHLMDRPITLVRFPDGIDENRFYQKHIETNLPDFVQTVPIYGEHASGDQRYMVCNNLPTLLWLIQLADLEIHTWQSRTNPIPDGLMHPTSAAGSLGNIRRSILNYPDYLLFDLDPYLYSGKEKSGAEPELNLQAFKNTCQAAKWIREITESLGLHPFVKTTGKTGLHIYIPLVRDLSFEEVRALSDTIGKTVLRAHPKDLTMEWSVPRRTGKVFVDHNMNTRGKTLASIYSPRVSPEAAVSMPFSWDDIDDIYPTDFTMRTVPKLLAERGDLWADILKYKVDLRDKLK